VDISCACGSSQCNKLIRWCLPFIFGLLAWHLPAQTDSLKYWIEFTDKAGNGYDLQHPEAFLSQRALDRRQRQGIAVDWSDMPVTRAYVDSLRSLGFHILYTSRWFNAAAVSTNDSLLISQAGQYSFVKDTRQVARLRWEPGYQLRAKTILQLPETGLDSFYGASWNQIHMLNGDYLHQLGYTGKGMVIAVIDAGFAGADTLEAFQRLHARGQILGTRDFVDGDTIVYAHHTHGMHVLSLMGGYLPGKLIGTAPDADFWLLRSEDGDSEMLIEEHNWVAAAEFADSAGADILSTSLGYFRFDDSLMNHTYADMDGNTTFITRAADKAASKGMLVVNSAGNEGNSSWQYIIAPADGDSVLTVGAVDANGQPATFTSHGPTFDGRVKPNVAVQGKNAIVASFNAEGIQAGNGTSFSCPILAGMAACLWQAFPDKSNMEIYHAIEQSADHYNNPDNFTGYGIPNFANALYLLDKGSFDFIPRNLSPVVYPNPFRDRVELFFYSPYEQHIIIRLFDPSGQLVWQKPFSINAQTYYSLSIGDLQRYARGLYALVIQSGDNFTVKKIIKQ